jgi:hypothetical protein
MASTGFIQIIETDKDGDKLRGILTNVPLGSAARGNEWSDSIPCRLVGPSHTA